MKKRIESNYRDFFVLFTSGLSFVIAALFLTKGLLYGFSLISIAIIAINFLYTPLAFIFAQKLFPFFYFGYSIFLIFATAFDQTFLYNNYTPLFVISIVVMLKPQLRWVAMLIYFLSATAAFCLNGESLIHFLIHIARSIWFIGIIEYVLNDKFRRKKLVLYEDEREILSQLATGMVYQKEVSGFSENTIYRKLKAARERNGNLTRDELVEAFKKEQESEQE